MAPDAVVIGAAAPRLPNTTAVAMPGVAAETQVIALDLDGVMVSAGAACSSGKVGPSHVLRGDGGRARSRRSTIRVSLGWTSSEADIAHFLEAWTALYRRAAGRSRERAQHDRICRSALVGQESARPNAMPIYLDNQSSTRLDPRVLEAMLPYFTEQFGNPHSRAMSTAASPPRRSSRRAARSPR